MPLSEPRGGGGLARSGLLFRTIMRSDGADTSINFISCGYDPVADVFLMGGNNSFCGIFSGAYNGKIQQFAALPNTVIASTDIQNIRHSDIDNGILVRSNNVMARTADGGATWVDITPAAAVTYADIISWRGTELAACAAGGAFDLHISSDNGATYPDTRDIFSAAVIVAEKATDDSIIVFACNSDRVFLTEDASLVTAVFDTFDLSALISFQGNCQTLAINPTGDEIILASNNGDIAVSIDRGQTWTRFDRDANQFRNGAAAFESIDYCKYIADLDGYILGGANSAAFIPSGGALDSMTPVFYSSNALYQTVSGEQVSATDGTDLVIAQSTNQSWKLAQKA